MEYSPHEYQEFAIRFIKEHPVAAVFLDMGMGKSSVTLTAVMDLMFESFEVCRVQLIGTPYYDASDSNFIRFDCGGYGWLAKDGELYKLYI